MEVHDDVFACGHMMPCSCNGDGCVLNKLWTSIIPDPLVIELQTCDAVLCAYIRNHKTL